MFVREVYSENVSIKYRSKVCSKAFLLVIISTVVNVCLPLLIAYRSQGFWLKSDSFFEMPLIRYSYEYLFIATTTNMNFPIICDSFSDNFISDMDRCTDITVQEIDNDFDGKYEAMHLNLTVKLRNDISITSLTLILTLDYSLHTVCPLQMQTAAIIQEMFSSPVTKYFLVGNLVLSQTQPIPCYAKGYHRFYNDSLLKEMRNHRLDRILNTYTRRNLTTNVVNSFTAWSPGRHTDFLLDVRLSYPEQPVHYKPNFWQVAKWACIQYVVIFILVRCIVERIKGYIFKNNLVVSYIVDRKQI